MQQPVPVLTMKSSCLLTDVGNKGKLILVKYESMTSEMTGFFFCFEVSDLKRTKAKLN